MNGVSYLTDLANAAANVFVACFYLACICIVVWTVAGCGERHVRRVERRRAQERWARRCENARVVHLRERDNA